MKRLLSFKEHFIIWIFVIFLSVSLLLIQHLTGGLTEQFWLSFIPSTIIDSVFILIASYLIAYLLQRNEKRKLKEKVYKMLGTRYESMVMNIVKDFIAYITKEPTKVAKDVSNMKDIKQQLENIKNNTNDYVREDFLRKGIRSLIIDNSINTGNIFDSFKEVELSVQQYTNYFKERHSKEIDAFISKYISVIPDDLRERIFKVEDTLQGNLFLTGREHGLTIDLSRATFDPEQIATSLGEFGEDIHLLLTYFEDIKDENEPKESKGWLRKLDDEKLIMGILYVLLSIVVVGLLFYT
ncbi:hypothetical protein EJF36_11595 [Bacillus sp. HMF5848]|uniref:hypothetical protein n=1 Tax=Bacillus sp. HMF5848 TaxID=2495421 RepID=UPI000F797EFE|nr:hypothetical protein [Bacillus sp. HMF5848]RSK27476.1 hypothetical protein EJF36_11595 [Bacillus sp. HMF5848]